MLKKQQMFSMGTLLLTVQLQKNTVNLNCHDAGCSYMHADAITTGTSINQSTYIVSCLFYQNGVSWKI